MRRRAFFSVVGGAAAWASSVNAQPAGKLPVIGIFAASSPSTWRPWISALQQRLMELGWVEGATVKIEVRWGEGSYERFADIASEFVRLNVDVVVTTGAGIFAVKQATSTIPLVFAAASDPIASGFVASLAHPGGNMTGLSQQLVETASKRVDLLREAIPSLRSLAVLANPGYPAAMLEAGEVQRAAHLFGFGVVTSEVRQAKDIAPAFEAFKSSVEALYVTIDPLLGANWVRINTAAAGARLPTIHGTRDAVEAGGLMSYGPNFPAMFRRAADYVDKILHGTKPGDIPVEQPTKFDLTVNLATAKALGITVPETLLARADEVIE